MERSRFAHLERHVLEAGKAAHEAKHLLGLCDGTSPATDCIEQLCIAVDELGIVTMALLNEAKPDQELLTEEQFRAQVVEGEAQP